jgi:hypothetical protein
VYADAGEGVAHLLQLERLDDGHDDLHVIPIPRESPARFGPGVSMGLRRSRLERIEPPGESQALGIKWRANPPSLAKGI